MLVWGSVGFRALRGLKLIIYLDWRYIGIMGKKMETTIIGYIGIIRTLGFKVST